MRIGCDTTHERLDNLKLILRIAIGRVLQAGEEGIEQVVARIDQDDGIDVVYGGRRDQRGRVLGGVETRDEQRPEIFAALACSAYAAHGHGEGVVREGADAEVE